MGNPTLTPERHTPADQVTRNDTENAGGTTKPEMTEHEARYRCIASMWEYALSPLPDDPTLDAWKRDQAIMRALVRGEVLPTTKHQLFSRAERPPLYMNERRRIRDAQTMLESLCPKYTDAFSEHDRDDLTRWIDEAEAHRAKQIQERREIARLAHVTEVQDHLFFALELAHKFNPAARNRIEDETRRTKEAWETKQNAPDKVRGYAAMADRAQETCDAYVKLLNELYSMPPTEEAKPDNVPAASIEQNRPTLTAAEADMIAEALDKRMHPHFDKLSGEINAKKQDARDNLAGAGRAITRLKAENTDLKAKIAALKP